MTDRDRQEQQAAGRPALSARSVNAGQPSKRAKPKSGNGAVRAGDKPAGARPADRTHRGGKALLKLLRILLRGPCRLTREDHQTLRLHRAEESAVFDEDVLARALSLGLALRMDETVAATPAATAFLRRALSAGDEAFADQHREVVSQTLRIDGVLLPVRRNLSESPLAPLTRLKDRSGEPFLPAAAIDAGERLLSDFTRGQMQPRITASWEPRLESAGHRRAGAGADISDTAMAARLRLARAVEAMGPELAGVALDVCCFCKGLETVERERQWPVRSAKLMLRAALLTLARHYTPPARKDRRPHHWGAQDFRPRMA